MSIYGRFTTGLLRIMLSPPRVILWMASRCKWSGIIVIDLWARAYWEGCGEWWVPILWGYWSAVARLSGNKHMQVNKTHWSQQTGGKTISHDIPSLCAVYIPHTAAVETNREKELMNREKDRERKQRAACRWAGEERDRWLASGRGRLINCLRRRRKIEQITERKHRNKKTKWWDKINHQADRAPDVCGYVDVDKRLINMKKLVT